METFQVFYCNSCWTIKSDQLSRIETQTSVLSLCVCRLSPPSSPPLFPSIWFKNWCRICYSWLKEYEIKKYIFGKGQRHNCDIFFWSGFSILFPKINAQPQFYFLFNGPNLGVCVCFKSAAIVGTTPGLVMMMMFELVGPKMEAL